MFATLNNPAAAYSKAGVEAKSETASPHELVIMLFDGALASIASATHHIQAGNIAGKGESISKAIEIIESGLNASLDYRTGGELAERLGALYEYMCSRLLHANLRNDKAALEEVSGLLRDLKSAWEEISNDSAVVSPTKAAA
jgi:flagellar protein FliS